MDHECIRYADYPWCRSEACHARALDWVLKPIGDDGLIKPYAGCMSLAILAFLFGLHRVCESNAERQDCVFRLAGKAVGARPRCDSQESYEHRVGLEGLRVKLTAEWSLTASVMWLRHDGKFPEAADRLEQIEITDETPVARWRPAVEGVATEVMKGGLDGFYRKIMCGPLYIRDWYRVGSSIHNGNDPPTGVGSRAFEPFKAWNPTKRQRAALRGELFESAEQLVERMASLNPEDLPV